jgi:hypothetical protein
VPVLQILLLLLAQTAAQPPAAGPAPGGSRPADIAFNVQMINPGYSESVAVADFNRDGKLDILSAESWYEAPDWIKHKVRDIPFNGSYIDNPGPNSSVEWVRHIIDYGGRAGGGLQMVVQDIDGDGDLDVITAGKTGLFLSESLLKDPKGRARARGAR